MTRSPRSFQWEASGRSPRSASRRTGCAESRAGRQTRRPGSAAPAHPADPAAVPRCGRQRSLTHSAVAQTARCGRNAAPQRGAERRGEAGPFRRAALPGRSGDGGREQGAAPRIPRATDCNRKIFLLLCLGSSSGWQVKDLQLPHQQRAPVLEGPVAAAAVMELGTTLIRTTLLNVTSV